MAENNDNCISDEVLLKAYTLYVIERIRNCKKRPDTQSICDYVNKFTNSKPTIDTLHLVIKSLITENKVVNKPTKQGLSSFYIVNETNKK